MSEFEIAQPDFLDGTELVIDGGNPGKETGGLVDGQAVASEEIKEIASLPSREQLVAKLLFLLQSPVTRLVRTLNELPRQFVGVLDQISNTKKDVSD